MDNYLTGGSVRLFKPLVVIVFLFSISLNAQIPTETNNPNSVDRIVGGIVGGVGGGIVGTTVGFGLGHAIQGRWHSDGYWYTITQLVGMGLMTGVLGKEARQIDDLNTETLVNELSDASAGLLTIGAFTFAISKFIESINVWKTPEVKKYYGSKKQVTPTFSYDNKENRYYLGLAFKY